MNGPNDIDDDDVSVNGAIDAETTDDEGPEWDADRDYDIDGDGDDDEGDDLSD